MILIPAKIPRSFFATQNFTAAWRVYCQWLERQMCLGKSKQVELVGCRINGRNCWEVLISQELHDDYLSKRSF